MKKQNIIMGISFVLLFVMVMGVSYAAYKFSATGTKENVISTGTISMSYKQNSFIDLKNTYPKTDIYAIGTKEDKSSMEFSVSMEVSGTTTINYVLALTEIQEGETLKSDKVKIYLEKEGKVVNNFETNKGQTIESFKNKYVEGLIDNYAIYQDVLTTSKETHNYTLTAWIDESYILPIKNETTTSKETNQETYKFKVKVVGVDTPITIKEGISTSVTGIASQVLPTLTSNAGDSGLYTITHAADSTLQIGATESITEYRYRGASPKNYVTFNNEVWRIIGIFPVDDGTGNIENRIKIVSESFGKLYSKGLCWNGNKTNDWTSSDLANFLSGPGTSIIHNGKTINTQAKYYLGGIGISSLDEEGETELANTLTSDLLYSYERKIKNGSCSLDSNTGYYLGTECYYYGTNPNSFIGKAGLLYASDYTYSSLECDNSKFFSEGDDTSSGCISKGWLSSSNNEYTITQFSALSFMVGGISKTGYFSLEPVYDIDNPEDPEGTDCSWIDFKVTIYLPASTTIISGDGTNLNSYQLEI